MRKYSVPFLVILLCTTPFMAFPCKADIVWSDNFDDGNYDGWNVFQGNFSIVDGALEAMFGSTILNMSYISSPSTVAAGTWSFDLYINPNIDRNNRIYVLFMLSHEYYNLTMEQFGGMLSKTIPEGNRWNTYTLQTFTGNVLLLQHVDITRNSDGRICVYLNRTLIIDVVDTDITTSNRFGFFAGKGFSIDNIVVSDTIDITPESLQPFYMQTWFIATVFTLVVTVIVILILLMRRK